jgi:hypothetical protein
MCQVVDFLCELGVVTGDSPGIMCDEGQPDPVVSDVDVGMMARSLCKLSDIVDERHGGDKVLQGALLNEFTVFEGPSFEVLQRLTDLIVLEFCHATSFVLRLAGGFARLTRCNPSFLGDLAATAKRERVRRYIFCDAGARGDIGAIAKRDRRDQR